MANMEFTYDPLELEVGYIRLLTLQPSPDPLADIECTIAHEATSQANYTALSYTWGSVEEKQFITLNRCSFAVTRNLFVALQHLRSGNESLTLWIDAICINQQDVDERTHQVRQMVEIYKNAIQVFIWMGEEIEHLDAAISLMNRCKQTMEPGAYGVPRVEGAVDSAASEFRRNGLDVQIKLVIEPVGFGVEGLVDLAEDEFRRKGWDALVKLLERPWWSRVWIVQEVVYGKDPVVVCGKHRFPWHLLQFFGESREIWNKITWTLLQQEKPFYSGKFVHASDRLDFICSVRASHPIGWQSLKALLCGVRASESTDPRDKVFAMLSLLKDDFQLCEVDYRASISQVYVEAAAGILKYTESLHFLSWTHNSVGTASVRCESSLPAPTVAFGRQTSRPVGLPSWAPSWSSAREELLELQSFDEAIVTKEPIQKIAEQMDENDYRLAVADAMEEALDAHRKDEDSDPAKLIESFEQLIKYGPKQNQGPKYPDKASFMLDIMRRSYFINTANRRTSWKTLFATSDTPSSRKRIYSATGNSLPCANCIIGKGILRVFGAAVDILEDVSPPCTHAFPLNGPPFA